MARFAFELAKHNRTAGGRSRSSGPAATSVPLVDFELEVGDITPLLEELKTYPIKVRSKHLRVATNAASKVVIAEARRDAPRGNGYLRRSLSIVITQKKGYVKASIGQAKGKTFKVGKRARGSQINRKGYAAPIHFILGGTDPHKITAPKRAGGNRGALALGGGRKRTFRTVIHHPGTRGDDFLERAQRAAAGPAGAAFATKLAERLNVSKVSSV